MATNFRREKIERFAQGIRLTQKHYKQQAELRREQFNGDIGYVSNPVYLRSEAYSDALDWVMQILKKEFDVDA